MIKVRMHVACEPSGNPADMANIFLSIHLKGNVEDSDVVCCFSS